MRGQRRKRAGEGRRVRNLGVGAGDVRIPVNQAMIFVWYLRRDRVRIALTFDELLPGFVAVTDDINSVPINY